MKKQCVLKNLRSEKGYKLPIDISHNLLNNIRVWCMNSKDKMAYYIAPDVIDCINRDGWPENFTVHAVYYYQGIKHDISEKDVLSTILPDLNNIVLMMHGGTIVDASLIAAPKSTKNQDGKRDPEMHQTKKGNEWYFGMKVHAGVDAGSGYVHTITGTSANMHDVSETANLIREDDEVVYGDSGYLGAVNQLAIKDDEKKSRIEFRVNKRPSSLKMADDFKGLNWDKKIEHEKSAVRCKVEHPFLIVKNQMGYSKVVYRGIAKNMHRFHMLFASANLLMCSRAGRTQDFIGGTV